MNSDCHGGWWSFEDECSECKTEEELNKHVIQFFKASMIPGTDKIELGLISKKLLTSLIDDCQVGAA